MSRTRSESRVTAIVGFAAAAGGDGVAYATLRGSPDGPDAFVRVGFRCRPRSALHGRDVAYAALLAVAHDLLRRGVASADFRVGDAELTADLDERRAVPAALTVPYVRLRCTLNRFAEARVAHVEDGPVRDLTARARAEISLNVAA